jgi:5-methylthioadenosine/S-adenosylhomocysteine deaminase
MVAVTKAKTLRAKWVLPIGGEPLENGEVVLEGSRIVEVRSASGSRADSVLDFGDAILMPGLVNVHTHLDYTLYRGFLEDLDFFPWIRELTLSKALLSTEDWRASAVWGAAEAVAGGVTTLGDCTDSGAAHFGAKTLGMRGIIYQEVFGIDEQQTVAEIVQDLKAKVAQWTRESEGTLLTVGISPHAPYTVRPALFQELARYAEKEKLPVCIHAAESQAEGELLARGQGTIAEMYARRGIDWTPPKTSTVAYLDSLGILGAHTLLVHGVQISAQDRHRSRAKDIAWAHCPKSNAKLGVGVAPFGLLSGREADGTNEEPLRVGLGSDSVASNNTMDMFEEMRFAVLMQRGARRQVKALTAKEAVLMATIGGAKALRLESEIGSLEAGKRADLCVVRLNDLHSAPAYHPYNALVYSARASDVVWTMIEGEVRYDVNIGRSMRDRFPHLNLETTYKQLQHAAEKLRQGR